MLVLDAGDSLIKDRPPATTSQGASSVELMNMMGYDAMALGEGDLEQLGVDTIRQRMAEADFPFLSANVYLSGTAELLVQPYLVRVIGERRVAIIGLTGVAQIPGLEIRDPLETVQEVVAQVQSQADILILLSHTGLQVNIQIAQEVPELALIVSGGGSGYTPILQSFGDGPSVAHADSPSPGHAGRRVGIALLSFDEQGGSQEDSWRNVPLGPEIADDPQMARWVARNVP